jgi:hypothetical protein
MTVDRVETGEAGFGEVDVAYEALSFAAAIGEAAKFGLNVHRFAGEERRDRLEQLRRAEGSIW